MMKKLASLLCVLLLLAGCAAQGDGGYAVEEMSLTDAMAAVLDGVENLPDYEITELTEENFQFFTFIPYAEGDSAVAADALIGSTPHSVVLARIPDGADQAEEEMRASADPRKWICVEAEKTVVRRYGDTILLVMSDTATANAILRNFDKLNGVETPEEDLAVPASDEQPEALPDEILNQPAELPAEGPAEMPTLTPGEDADDNMPAVEPGNDAVEMPTVQPEPEKPTVVPAPEPEKPQTVVPAPTPEPQPEPQPEPTPTPEPPAQAETDLSALMAQLLDGVELPAVGDIPLDADNFAYYAFVPYADGCRGLASEAMMNAIAHSVVLVEVPEGGDAAQAAADMASGADPRKWICVEAESVQTASKGRLALLVMSDQTTADAIIANFNAL